MYVCVLPVVFSPHLQIHTRVCVTAMREKLSVRCTFFDVNGETVFSRCFEIVVDPTEPRMRGTTNAMFNDRFHYVKLRIWFKTGFMLEDIYALEQTTFADVKLSAVRQFLINENMKNLSTYRRSSFNTVGTARARFSLDEMMNYKLISIRSKRIVNEDKTLGEERVRDEGTNVDERSYLM
jgi:hypothetical protein